MITMVCQVRVDRLGAGIPRHDCPFRVVSDDVDEAVRIYREHMQRRHPGPLPLP